MNYLWCLVVNEHSWNERKATEMIICEGWTSFICYASMCPPSKFPCPSLGLRDYYLQYFL